MASGAKTPPGGSGIRAKGGSRVVQHIADYRLSFGRSFTFQTYDEKGNQKMPVGVSQTFTLNAGTPTLLSPARADPAGRVYFLIINNDRRNYIAWALGTNNQASPSHHQIAPGGWYEWTWKPPFGVPLPQVPWGPMGDISAIAVTGNPSISYLEL